MPYLLDGNNLIGLARKTSRPSEEDRTALLVEIAGRLRRSKASVVVFFDGTGARSSSLGNLSIRASAGSSADDAIVNEIQGARAPREIIVVTADRGLVRRACDLGAQALSPQEFWNRVGKTGAASEGKADPRVDVEEWKRYFEDPRNRGC